MRNQELSEPGAPGVTAALDASRITHHASRITHQSLRSTFYVLRSTSSAFTFIELILVMTVLTIAVSFTAPALSNFFRGRTLDSEARRLLALTRVGQSRAASEGIPMELWIDSNQGMFGLEAEPSYESVDSKAVDVTLDGDIQITIENAGAGVGGIGSAGAALGNSASANTVRSRHAYLPRIRFLPDGTLSDISPLMVRLTGRDGGSLWLAQSQNRRNYEIRRNN